MYELIHMTAAYSNAVLLAILPQISDFAQKLDLPVAPSLTLNQVIWANVTPVKERIQAGLVLTNHYWFAYADGYVLSFRAPDDWFFEQDPEIYASNYVGRSQMTTNQAIDLARETLRKLGYKPEAMHAGRPPEVDGPFDCKAGHIPYCKVRWDDSDLEWDRRKGHVIYVEINMQMKRVVGLTVIGPQARHPPPKVDVVPELEADYQKRVKGKMFLDTNGSPRLPTNMPTE